LNSWTDEDADDDDEFQPPPDDQLDSDEEYRDDKGVRVSSTEVQPRHRCSGGGASANLFFFSWR